MMVETGTLAWNLAIAGLMAASLAVGSSSAAGAFDPKQPDPDAAKKAEAEAKRKKQAEIAGRQGRGKSIVTGGAGLVGEQTSSLGSPSLLGSA